MIKKILQKLSSRKFWAALIGFVSTVCVALGVSSITTEQVCAVIGACATLCVYILAETYIDAKSSTDTQNTEKEEK
ncbi:MAG: hypothetical protein IJZ93_04420 [Clostridia bacterium]|nr:hypothetical protein [Clostridia bacterium]